MYPADALVAQGGLWLRLTTELQGLRGHRLPWVALTFGFGIGVYFALPLEPDRSVAWTMGVACGACAVLAWMGRGGAGFIALLAAILIAGVLAAQLRTNLVAGPVLGWRYYGAVEGRIVEIDRSASGAVRLTLDRVRLDRMGPAETPRRVRVSLQDETGVTPKPGLRVMTTAHLSPPAGPTEPGGFDFQRHAWFLKLGAIGYGRVPLLLAEAPRGGSALWIARLRAHVGENLRDRLPGQVGEVAAAITTGDRSGLTAEVTEALRASNLAHLLAISGLHMGLLVGFVFWAVRGGLALVPPLALNYPTREWAAAIALPFALFYLFLSGGTVATQRAFVMAAVMLGAILLGARALSIRSVAIAAIAVLLWRPESLTGPGFQMSFAATGALVVVFNAISRRQAGSWLRGWKGAILSLLLSSIVAGAATGPFAALHFNRVGQFGVLANMLAVPMMGMAVMPLLLVGLLLMPLGLETLPLMVAGWGIEWILEVARRVAELPGAVRPIPAPDWRVLPVLGLGMAMLAAARGWGTRGVAITLLGLSVILWTRAPRPEILISDDARLVGVMSPAGRWLSRDSGAGFVAESWLENDGDPVSQAEAAARPTIVDPTLPEIHVARGKRDLPAAIAACQRGNWIVSANPVTDAPVGCTVFDQETMRDTGAVATSRDASGYMTITTAKEVQGMRPWVPLPGG
ncbi:ComEC/Rec2 family competence protein [uncultured Jannaschia sp.]|uniref:ComEC/Rec2 family competence protein n=1 Tax=uncultured Jannaschia sp. TaxID=293347 RepID=UPI00260244FA|nr:ComEC/Rec2 family competence protein [uncultured Jannaschia sp.]